MLSSVVCYKLYVKEFLSHVKALEGVYLNKCSIIHEQLSVSFSEIKEYLNYFKRKLDKNEIEYHSTITEIERVNRIIFLKKQEYMIIEKDEEGEECPLSPSLIKEQKDYQKKLDSLLKDKKDFLKKLHDAEIKRRELKLQVEQRISRYSTIFTLISSIRQILSEEQFESSSETSFNDFTSLISFDDFSSDAQPHTPARRLSSPVTHSHREEELSHGDRILQSAVEAFPHHPSPPDSVQSTSRETGVSLEEIASRPLGIDYINPATIAADISNDANDSLFLTPMPRSRDISAYDRMALITRTRSIEDESDRAMQHLSSGQRHQQSCLYHIGGDRITSIDIHFLVEVSKYVTKVSDSSSDMKEVSSYHLSKVFFKEFAKMMKELGTQISELPVNICVLPYYQHEHERTVPFIGTPSFGKTCTQRHKYVFRSQIASEKEIEDFVERIGKDMVSGLETKDLMGFSDAFQHNWDFLPEHHVQKPFRLLFILSENSLDLLAHNDLEDGLHHNFILLSSKSCFTSSKRTLVIPAKKSGRFKHSSQVIQLTPNNVVKKISSKGFLCSTPSAYFHDMGKKASLFLKLIIRSAIMSVLGSAQKWSTITLDLSILLDFFDEPEQFTVKMLKQLFIGKSDIDFMKLWKENLKDAEDLVKKGVLLT
ncbi:hypothetical protein ADUPG1_012256 [Aduncisulcus paluster]|uniref:Uncharacterized protein n=1 Tax=Aduncisulcus paluster TaxID=2918883 RepID=A0ABQ5JZL5_9EUKA|nr:hypothetical protein ADUPG1_012256 [Aduncisulcus paluster]